jgi:hypothetical protein
MKKLISLIALLIIGCLSPKPNPNPPPQPDAGSSGGSGGYSTISSTNEDVTAGNSNIITGGSSTGGSVNGGTTSCSPIEPLVPQPITERQTREIKKPHTVGKRHHRKPGRARRTIEKVTEELCPVLHDINDTIPLDQDKPQAAGSCTGNAGVTAISTQHFQGNQRHNQTDARLAYQGGTCEDNHCTIPCTCESCPAAFCPTTGINDTGSTGSSVMAWMTAVKWIKGYTTADTIDDLKACIANGSNPVIGIDWYSSFDNPSTTSVLTIGGYIRGGHELGLIGWDGTNFIGINSWGLWGFCRKSQITSDTPYIGTGCGYFKISPNTLQRAKFDGDCPKLN